ncbi:reverse transcriptase, partial [Oesophagostomum dentatum]
MPSSLSGDELARLEKELLGDRSVEKESPTNREEYREKPSTRRKRKRESSSSDSSSETDSSSASSSSSGSSDVSDSEYDVRKRAAEARKKKYLPQSPLENGRIPKRIDFAGAVKEAPEIARIEFKKLRTRVDVDPAILDHFNKCAAGMYAGTEDKLSFFDRLPLVSSGLASPPVLDEGLPKKSFSFLQDTSDEGSLVADAEVLLNAMNLLAIARNEARESRHERADLYVEQAMEVLAFGVEANVTRRRERFLRSFGVEPFKVVPNFHRFPVEEPVHSADLPWNEVCPALMGTKLTTEIVEKSQCRKLTEALVKEARSKRREAHSAKGSFAQLQPLGNQSGRLALFAKNWAQITDDPWVLEAIQGYRLRFLAERPSLAIQTPMEGPPNELVASEIVELLKKGAIQRIPWTTQVWSSHIFLVPKKDGRFRTVINLRPLNAFIEHNHFKLESLGMVKDLLNPGDFMAKVDMKDAYFAVPIHEESRPYLAFQYNQELYWFTALPFGLSSAPYVYTRIMKVVAARLRRQGVRLLVYLDDWIFFGSDAEGLRKDVSNALSFFAQLGLTVNYEKSQLVPSQTIEFLGLELDSTKFVFKIPDRKISSIVEEAQDLLSKDSTTLLSISRFIGRVNSVSRASGMSVLYLRNLQSWLGKFKPTRLIEYQASYPLPNQCKDDISWFVTRFRSFVSEPILPKDFSYTFTSDASDEGWGAVGPSGSTSGRWRSAEKRWHINEKELTACYFGLRCFGENMRNTTLRLELDN